jgi:hypothetical protein
MKLKHNKKRNTAFLFETIVRELTRSAIRKDTVSISTCKEILKEHFSAGTVLHRELRLYQALCETHGLSKHSAEKLLQEIRTSHRDLMSEASRRVFTEQSAVIDKINKSVSKNAFSNFIPQYKNIATVYQIFNGGVSPERRVLLEDIICESLSTSPALISAKPDPAVDSLIMKNFVKKFNDRYGKSLQTEQSKLLNNYVLSFADNGLVLKAYLHEEIGRLRKIIKSGLKMEEIKPDQEMVEKTNLVLKTLDNCSSEKINNKMLESILKIQSLAMEIEA